MCAQQAKHTNARADRSVDIGHCIPFIIGRLLHMFFFTYEQVEVSRLLASICGPSSSLISSCPLE